VQLFAFSIGTNRLTMKCIPLQPWHVRCTSEGGSVTPASKFLPLMATMLLLAGVSRPVQGQASAQVSISEATLTPGSTGVLQVRLAAIDPGLTGIQFDIDYDSAALELTARTTPGLTSASKRLYTKDIRPGSKRILIVGMNQTRIPDGAVLELAVTLRSGVPGSYSSVQLLSTIGNDADGAAVPVSTRPGGVAIGEPGATRVNGVLNAASFRDGPVSPGEIVSIFGTGFSPQTTVIVNETPAPVLSIHATQINVVIPYSVAGAASARVLITAAGGPASFEVAVAEAAPGIFTASATGSGPGAVLNEDLTVNSPENPALRTSVIALFVTGGGQTDPPGTDGSVNNSTAARLLLPVTAEIDGAPAEVLYAGPAPGLVSGIFQVNLRIPQSAARGRAVSVVLSMGTARTQPGVTVQIQ
jgi:uncharacterized protein (TIGR03437 family)